MRRYTASIMIEASKWEEFIIAGEINEEVYTYVLRKPGEEDTWEYILFFIILYDELIFFIYLNCDFFFSSHFSDPPSFIILGLFFIFFFPSSSLISIGIYADRANRCTHRGHSWNSFGARKVVSPPASSAAAAAAAAVFLTRCARIRISLGK